MCQVIGSENGRSCASQATVIGMYGNAMDGFLQLLKTNDVIGTHKLYVSHQGNEWNLVPISFSDTDT